MALTSLVHIDPHNPRGGPFYSKAMIASSLDVTAALWPKMA